MAEDVKPIVLGSEIDPEEAENYRQKIRSARGGVSALKGSEPVGSVPKPQGVPLARSAQDRAVASNISETGGVVPRPPGSRLLSQETVAGIQAMAKEATEATTAAKAEAEAPKEKKEEDPFDLFDFTAPRNEAERLLNNKKLRIAIESRCSPMSLDDLILKDEVRQVVPITTDQLTVTYRSMTSEENLFIKKFISKNDQGMSDQYVLERYALCQLVCSVVDINGKPLQEHLNGDGSVDEKAFESKLRMLMKKSSYLLAALSVNFVWFDIRVRRLFNPDELGNG